LLPLCNGGTWIGGVGEQKEKKKYLDLKENKHEENLEKLRNAELHIMYSLPNIIVMIRSKLMCWLGRVA
jgi:hypothetical protein